MTMEEYKANLDHAKNDAVTIYLSEIRTICKLRKPEQRDEAFRLFLLQGLTEEQVESDDLAIDMFVSDKLQSQIQRRQNHEKAIQNGSKGGRPETIDRNKVFELRAKGYTQQQIANELKCSISSVRNILSSTTIDNHQKPLLTHDTNDDRPYQSEAEAKNDEFKELFEDDELPF